MKKRMSALLLALFLMLSSAAPALADGFDREVLSGVVYIQEDVYLEGEYLGSWRGTAFFVGEQGEDPQYLVTNHHVIEHFLATGGGQGESRLYVVYEQNDYEEAFLVDYNADMDLAVLKLDQPTDKRIALPLELPTQDLVGSNVYAVGYPSVADNAVNALASFRTEDATVTTGSVSRLLTESGTGRRVLQLDVSIQGGNSGGPLVTEVGTVVGINTFGVTVTHYNQAGEVTSEASVDYALNVEELIPLLDKNGVPYQLGKNDFPLLLVLIAAVVVVVVVVVVLLLVGRDGSVCGIVFKEGTPGVSARHCSVVWDGRTGEFLLTDLKSTYGTFLATGQKLTPGVACRLKAGDTFYLGEQSNALRVELG